MTINVPKLVLCDANPWTKKMKSAAEINSMAREPPTPKKRRLSFDGYVDYVSMLSTSVIVV